MATGIDHIVIVGGGTAGWLAACMIAAKRSQSGTRVTLVEAPDIPTIGVGEGTWPTMRRTLAAIGIGEAEFLTACDASFKQGSRFDGWADGEPGDSYLHPFTAPPESALRDPIAAWAAAPERSFAEAVSPQSQVCQAHQSPRQLAMPEYSGALNYAYHLDAGKLAALLQRRACDGLGVRHVSDRVTDVVRDAEGAISAVVTQCHGEVFGDLFIDCTGHAARLIAGEFDVPWVDRTDALFNDRALAVQIGVDADSAIASPTIATAHAAGWIWDIGLPTRRGIGCVFASQFVSDEDALQVLKDYVARAVPGGNLDQNVVRSLSFQSGHRERFWEKNCLAIGLSAGFLEPLEASAIVMIELSLNMLLDNFPANRASLPVHAARFNRRFRYRWDRIVDFLKLHYVLSRRQEPYWRAHREARSIPESLGELMTVWRHQSPSPYDFPEADEVFPAASYQYVLYGMQGRSGMMKGENAGVTQSMTDQMREIERRGRALCAALPTNRTYLDALRDQKRAHAPEAA